MSRRPDSVPLESRTLVQEMDILIRGVENFLETSGKIESSRIIDLFRQINSLQLRRAFESMVPGDKTNNSFALHETDRQLMLVRQSLIEYLRRKIPRGPVLLAQIIRGEKLGTNDEKALSNYRAAADKYQGDERNFAYAN